MAWASVVSLWRSCPPGKPWDSRGDTAKVREDLADILAELGMHPSALVYPSRVAVCQVPRREAFALSLVSADMAALCLNGQVSLGEEDVVLRNVLRDLLRELGGGINALASQQTGEEETGRCERRRFFGGFQGFRWGSSPSGPLALRVAIGKGHFSDLRGRRTGLELCCKSGEIK